MSSPSRTPGQRQADHDLLIEIKVKLMDLTKKVEDFTAQPKADPTIQNDHESRIRRLEWALAIAVGAISLFEFITRFVK